MLVEFTEQAHPSGAVTWRECLPSQEGIREGAEGAGGEGAADMLPLFSRRVPAGFEMGEVVGVIVGAIILTAAVYAGSHYISTQNYSHAANVNVVTLDDIRNRIDNSAYESQAIFVPALDVHGQSNANGHEIDIYGQDVNHAGHFVAYCYKAAAGNACSVAQAAGTLGFYEYQWAQLTQNGGGGVAMVGGPIATLSKFAATTATTPSQFANAIFDPVAAGAFASYASVPSWPSAQTYHWGYAGVTSSTGRIYNVSMSIGQESIVAMVDADHIPFAASGAIGTQTPTPNPLKVVSPLAFRAPIAAAQTAVVSESNYGNRVTAPAQNYVIGTGCNSLATVGPGSTVTPTNNGTGDATLSVTPLLLLDPSGATCSISVTDNTPQTQTVNVTIGKTFVAAASGATISFSAGATAPVTITEQNYDVAAPAGRGGFSFVGYVANGGAALTTAVPTDPNGVCEGGSLGTAPARTASSLGSPPSYVETENWSVGFAKAGVCWPVFRDVYGQLVSVNGAAGLIASSPMATWPQSFTVGVSGAQVGASSGAVAFVPGRFDVASLGPIVNMLLAGGVARAASGDPCYALAETTSGAPDTSILTVMINGRSLSSLSGITVDSTGCEIYTATLTPVPAANAGVIAYEPGGSGSTFSFTTGCPPNIHLGPWNPASGVQATLITTSSSSAACSISINDGSNSATNKPDAGLVAVTATNCTGAGKMLSGGSCYDVFRSSIPCESYDAYTGQTFPSCGAMDPYGDDVYQTVSDQFYYTPDGDEGVYMVYKCAADGTNYYTADPTLWHAFAHAYFANDPTYGAFMGVYNNPFNTPEPNGINGTGNPLGLGLLDEFNAPLIPVQWIPHYGPPCNLQPPPLQ